MKESNNNHPKIGVLYDSYHDNTGDSAIGIVMGDFLNSNGIEFTYINPTSKNKNDFDIIIIGGGQIMREPGSPYYDNFRIWGKHILNAADFTEVKNADFLKYYRYVSVRNSSVASLLSKKGISAAVIPDICIAMVNRNTGINLSEDSIGIHLLPPGDEKTYRQQVSYVKSLATKHKIVLIPITHYAKDAEYLRRIHKAVPNTTLLGKLEPQIIFDTIGGLKMLISMSLHGAIFAYAQNVSFIVWDEPTTNKMYKFFKDRGLQHRIFNNTNELASKTEKYLNSRHDFKNQIEKDQKSLNSHFKYMAKLIKRHSRQGDSSHYEMLNELEKDRNQMMVDLKEEEYKLNIANAKLKTLGREIKTIKNTKSWKITEKLNNFRKLF